MDEREIRNLLERTWSPFFARFGKLKEVQKKTIPYVIKGCNLVVSSPTASGKTEAVLAPLTERILKQGEDGLKVIWVSPTRALVNDLYLRFKIPLNELPIRFDRKTGDRPQLNEREPPQILITTPESLDSIVCRFPKLLLNLLAIVLDDIHLLDCTYRGDQILSLLRRVELIRGGKIEKYALSATIRDPYSLGERYLGEFELVEAKEGREIEFYLIKRDRRMVKEIFSFMRERDLKKLLIFTNARHEAELLRKEFEVPPYNGLVLIHHGSLSKKERESIEAFLEKSRVGICIATTTLELGIDIGDVDAVLLYSPPTDVRSFLQRIGRGGRRRGIQLGFGIFKDDWERIVFEILFEDAKKGELWEELCFHNLSVAVQQVLSYLYQRRRVGTTINSIMRVIDFLITREELTQILFELEERGYLRRMRDEILFPADRLIRRGDRGYIHSNIERKRDSYMFVNTLDGKEIGMIQLASPQFELGGRYWEVVEFEKDIAWVRPATGVFIEAGKVFKGKGLYWDFRLGKRLKEKLFYGLKEEEFPFLRTPEFTLFFHLSGPVHGFLWQSFLREKGYAVTDYEGRFLVLKGAQKIEDILPSEMDFFSQIERNYLTLRKFLNIGLFQDLLPQRMRVENLEKALFAKEFLKHIASMIPVEVSSHDASYALEILGGS